MTKDELMQMARDAKCGHESMTMDWIPPDGLERLANAILERAAVNFDNHQWIDIFTDEAAEEIRAMKIREGD